MSNQLTEAIKKLHKMGFKVKKTSEMRYTIEGMFGGKEERLTSAQIIEIANKAEEVFNMFIEAMKKAQEEREKMSNEKNNSTE